MDTVKPSSSQPSTCDATTKHKLDNIYDWRNSVVDGFNRATGVMVAHKIAVVCRLR